MLVSRTPSPRTGLGMEEELQGTFTPDSHPGAEGSWRMSAWFSEVPGSFSLVVTITEVRSDAGDTGGRQ